MIDLFVALLPECESRLRTAELLAADTLRTDIVADLEDKTVGGPDLKASSHSDAWRLVKHFKKYAESVFDAFAEECISSKRDFDEYVKMLHCAIGFADEMLPKKLISPDDYYDYSSNPQLWSKFSPSGYWEITFRDCRNKLQDRRVLRPRSDVGDRFDRVFRCALRLEDDARKFRRCLESHLESRTAYWEKKWREQAHKQPEVDSDDPSPDQDSGEKEQAVANKKPGRPPYSEDLKLQALAALNEGKSMREATKILRKLKRSPTGSEVASTHGFLGYYLNNHPGTWTPSDKAREKYPALCKRAEQLKKA